MLLWFQFSPQPPDGFINAGVVCAVGCDGEAPLCTRDQLGCRKREQNPPRCLEYDSSVPILRFHPPFRVKKNAARQRCLLPELF